MSTATDLREELAHHEAASACCARPELSALLRLGGSLTRRGGDEGAGWVMETAVGAVARRARALLDGLDTGPVTVEVHQPVGLRVSVRYRVRVRTPVGAPLTRLGLLDGAGRPTDALPAALTTRNCDAAAYVRGALMAAGSLSAPGAAAHLEVAAPGAALAHGLVGLLARCGMSAARASQRADGSWRVVCKSGEGIAAVLARTGAHATFLRWDAARLQRELRGEANRAANADRANAWRAVTAASRQAALIDVVLGSPEWEQLSPEVRAVALARLANPEASLAELGELLDPPVGKVTVHRRLARLAQAGARRKGGTEP